MKTFILKINDMTTTLIKFYFQKVQNRCIKKKNKNEKNISVQREKHDWEISLLNTELS